MPLRPEGKFTLAASQIKAFDAAHDTSRVFSILKCQVKVPWLVGRLDASPTSPSLTIITVLSLSRASFKRATCVEVNTCTGFSKSPDPTTTISDGAVM